MDLKFEAVVLPVSDVDRAKRFYGDTLGFREDIDHRSDTFEEAIGFRLPGKDTYRIVQFTPPGSPCSILLGDGVTDAAPGSYQGMHLVTDDIEAARADLVARGVDAGEIFHFGPDGKTSGVAPGNADYSSYLQFSDPDGNGWLVQEIRQRAPGR